MVKERIGEFWVKASESKSKIFLLICFSFVFGIFFSSLFLGGFKTAFYFFCAAVFLSVIFFVFKNNLNKKQRLAFFCATFFIFGLFRGGNDFSGSEEIKNYNGNFVNLTGKIADEPDVRENQIQLIVESEKIGEKNTNGRILIKVPRYPEYNYGDKVSVSCKLAEPEIFSDFNYAEYLSRDNIFSTCNFPARIEVLEKGTGNQIFAAIYGVKNVFSEKLKTIFSEPHASFLGGLLYGEKQGIPAEIKNDFRITGVAHIIAVSGYNITIVISILFVFLMFLWIPKKFAFYFAALGVIFFTLVSGAEASIVRAAIMGFVVLLAQQIGRPGSVINVIMLAASLMLFQNPKLLVFDIGFQLSFAATLGLVYISPIIEKRFPKFLQGEMREIAITTISATIAVTPLVLFSFGNFSFVAILTNLAILPFIPAVMFFGFIAVIAGFVSIQLGQIVGFVAWMILNYILKIVELFAQIPYASVNLGKAPVWFLVLCYGILIYWVYNKRKNKKAREEKFILSENKDAEEFVITE